MHGLYLTCMYLSRPQMQNQSIRLSAKCFKPRHVINSAHKKALFRNVDVVKTAAHFSHLSQEHVFSLNATRGNGTMGTAANKLM